MATHISRFSRADLDVLEKR